MAGFGVVWTPTEQFWFTKSLRWEVQRGLDTNRLDLQGKGRVLLANVDFEPGLGGLFQDPSSSVVLDPFYFQKGYVTQQFKQPEACPFFLKAYDLFWSRGCFWVLARTQSNTPFGPGFTRGKRYRACSFIFLFNERKSSSSWIPRAVTVNLSRMNLGSCAGERILLEYPLIEAPTWNGHGVCDAQLSLQFCVKRSVRMGLSHLHQVNNRFDSLTSPY